MRLTSRIISAALASLFFAVGARPAVAMTGDCLWAHLDPRTRSTLVEGYQRQGPEVLDKVYISDGEFEAIDNACASLPVDESLKERLLAATVFEHGAAVFLERRLNWDDRAINAAWARLLPHHMAALRRGADAVLLDQPPSGDDLSGPVNAFLADDAARRDPAVADQARGYLTSRAMREAVERKTALAGTPAR